MEGGITRFSSGIAGVAVVLFALMGTIGVGYLLNGSSGYETVNDYDYVTDVSGLYSYTPVPAYATYSPATNNYQYSETIDDLGRYTTGINYTPAGAANLNPVLVPGSGLQEIDTTFDPLINNNTSMSCILGYTYYGESIGSDYSVRTFDGCWIGTVDEFIALAVPGQWNELTIHTSTNAITFTGYGQTYNIQQVGVVYDGPYTTSDRVYQAMLEANATAANLTNFGIQTSITNSYSSGNTSSVYPPGIISDLHVRANGIVEYTYTIGDVVRYVSAQASTLKIYVGGWDNQYTSPSVHECSVTGTNWINIEYLDPNAGVSLDSSPVYWSNGNDLGSVTWAFKKPTAASSIRVAQLTAGGQTMNEFVVSWSGAMWQMSYLAPGGTQTTVDLGSGWQAVYVRAFYTGELQTGPIDGFFNFTSYTLGPATTYATSYTGNVPIDHCQISGSTTMKFACIGTTARTGVVPGAMFDATFTASSWFPGLASVRVSFDSAAYVGSAVRVGSWRMAVDSGTFIGDLQDVDGITFRADLTQPWAVTWNPGSTSVSLTFTPYQQAGTQTITILADDDSRTVNLDGQWAIDTDLYSVGTHIEEVYEWNFGNWGLDKEQFIVCAMGLTALLAIAFKLARVPFHALDFVVIFLGNLILWVIM